MGIPIGNSVEVEIDETPAIIAAATIAKMSEAMEKIYKTGLNRRAIVTLLKGSCPRVALEDIEKVLTGLENMRKDYLSPDEKGKKSK